MRTITILLVCRVSDTRDANALADIVTDAADDALCDDERTLFCAHSPGLSDDARSLGAEDTDPQTVAIEDAGKKENVERVRAVLAKRKPCDPSCPGWAVFNGDHLERCDDCTVGLNLFDDDIEALPEAQEALAAALAKGEDS